MLPNRTFWLATTAMCVALPHASATAAPVRGEAIRLAYLDSPWRECRRSYSWWACVGRAARGELGSSNNVPSPPEPWLPPPPPPPPPCVTGPFMVFFDWDRDDVTPQAAAILDNAVSAYALCGQAQVMLAGHADRSGPDAYNAGLSRRRAAKVAAYLTGRGIPAGVVTQEAFGESRPLVETGDSVQELQNRRVEITFGPGSGW